MREISLSCVLRTQNMSCSSLKDAHSEILKAAIELPDLHIATASHDGTVKLWRAQVGLEPRRTMQGHSDQVYALAYLGGQFPNYKLTRLTGR